MRHKCFIHAAFSTVLLASTAQANIGQQLTGFFNALGGAANVSNPGAYRDQTAGYYTGGNIFARTSVHNAQLATLQPPGYRAGCGGIDMFMGAFSHLSSAELIKALKAIGSNMGSYALLLAIETMSPVIKNIVTELNDLVQKINQSNINSCEIAATTLGAVWPKSEVAQGQLCKMIGTEKKYGAFSDYAAARQECGAGGGRDKALSAAKGDPAFRSMLGTEFNLAIAALISANTGILYHALARLGLIVGLLWATILMIQGDVARFVHNWVVPLYVTLTLFFAPTCKVHIFDPVSNYRFTVANVPWGLGMVAGTISQMGDTLTQQIEKTFSLPDDLKYHKTGAVMASNLIAQSRTFQVTNADLAETLRSFMIQCVVYDALLGRKYTLDDLRNTPDIWKLATEQPSPARCFTFKEPGKGHIPEILTCQAGSARLKKLLDGDVQNAFRRFNHTLFGKPSEQLSRIPLKQYLPSAFNYMSGLGDMAKSAEDLMMQQMMIYGTVDAIETKSTALGNAPNFAVRRAYLQQRSNQETLAGVAGQKIVAMKNVLEALIYAAFIFILPLALLPSG